MREKNEAINFKQEMLGGFSAGVVGTVIGYPLDLVKTRMQTSDSSYRKGFLRAQRGWDIRNGAAGALGCWGSAVYTGSWHCMTTLVKERGWTVIYTGHAVNTVREAFFLGTYFYTYEGLRVFLQSAVSKTKVVDKDHTAAWTVPIAGGISGAWAWFITFPLDCIKAGVQGQDLSRLTSQVSPTGEVLASQKLKSMDVLKDLLKTKGWRGLYSGVSPSIMRAFVVSGSRFSAYEFAVKLFGDYLR
eukprot:scaffold2625_cov277-Chaetoceros_neogracile.AAC.14